MTLLRLLGSVKVAVLLLVAIAAVLGWGTIYETRFGTAAVQRFVYQSAWFQAVLGFLALNLMVAALRRWPWRRRHVPFVLAHLGIILILAGGIVGGRFGVEGQLRIPEGTQGQDMQLPYHVLVVHQPNPGVHHEFRTHFETAAWNQKPHALFEVPAGEAGFGAGEQPIQLVVDRYYPNAERHEQIEDDGSEDNPAVHIVLKDEEHEDGIWLLSREPGRFGARWGEAHVFFLEPASPSQIEHLLAVLPPHSIGILRLASGGLKAVLTGSGDEREHLNPLEAGREYLHPALGYRFEVTASYPRARRVEHYTNRDNEVRQPALHVVGRRGEKTGEAWVPLGEPVRLALGEEPIVVEYRPAARRLPFTVRLIDFRKIDYPGTAMAAGFESDVELADGARGITLKRRISMNNPLKYRGYSLFQSSYVQGPVEETILSVRNDPGTPLVYGGFLIVLAGIVALFVSRRRPRVLIAMACLAWAAGGAGGRACADEPVTSQTLAVVRSLPIQHNGRVKPFDSFAREVVDRLTGFPRWRAEDPALTLLSILAWPDRWQEEPILSVPFIPLRQALGLDRKRTHLSYSELVAGHQLMRMLPPIVQKQRRDEKLTLFENEVMELYDRFGTFTDLTRHRLFLVPPPEGDGPWLPVLEAGAYPAQRQAEFRAGWERFIQALRGTDPAAVEQSAAELGALLAGANRSAYPAAWRIRLEVFYNDLAPLRIARWLYLLGAFLLLFARRGWLVRPLRLRSGQASTKPAPDSIGGSARTAWVGTVGLVFLLGAFVLHGAGIVVRVVLGGRPPVSNFYESMLWIPWVGVAVALVFERIYRDGLFGFSSSALAAVLLLLADHLPLDSSISPVVAVLRSNLWLTVHVLTIVGSYAPIALAAVLAHLYGILFLARGARAPALARIDLFLYRSLQVGVVLLAAGIMLGAVWANASWGRYWGWDPKETWALITLLWYLSVLHGRFAGWLRGVGVALATIAGFFLLLMTYYGVSFYLVGLHSYAGGTAKPIPPLLAGYLAAEALFIAWVGIAALRRRGILRAGNV